MTIKNVTIITEEQLLLLSYLNRYSEMLYRFSNYNDYTKWLEDEEEIDKAIEAVTSGSYVNSDSMETFVNNCILSVELIENE